MKKLILILAVVGVAIAGYFYYSPKADNNLADSPKNATYIIGDKPVTLVDGKFEEEIAPGAASKRIVMAFNEPVYGDLDGDADDDALMLITDDSGGSGTFYYAVVAVNDGGKYKGTNAILLGDRIAPQTTEMRTGVAIANYADRAPGEPMTARPSIGKSAYMTLGNGKLKEIAPLSKGEQVLFGYLTIGHEARSFRPCGEGQPEYWLSGDSPALDKLKKTYADEVSDVLPAAYAPLFAVVSGKIVAAPEDGFGADYDYALRVSEFVRADREGSCKSDLVVASSPLAGSTISSPLTVEGFARGLWYFEASFPIVLTDWDGKIIAEHYVTAEEDPSTGEVNWMTEKFVPFKGVIEFKKPESANGFSKRGTLILKKDNPSGLPEHDDALEIPVYF